MDTLGILATQLSELLRSYLPEYARVRGGERVHPDQAYRIEMVIVNYARFRMVGELWLRADRLELYLYHPSGPGWLFEWEDPTTLDAIVQAVVKRERQITLAILAEDVAAKNAKICEDCAILLQRHAWATQAKRELEARRRCVKTG